MLATSKEASPVNAAFVLGREYGNASLEDAGHIVDELGRLHDMPRSPEDVRGADVGEARDGWFCLRTVVNLLSMGCAEEALAVGRAALRSPERAYVFDPSDPWVERAERFIQSREKVSKRTGREIKDKGAVNIMRGLLAALRSPEPAAEPRYTLAEVADILEAEAEECRAADGEVSALEGWRDASRWLRSGGATTETGKES
jgi:hypothetical protein